MSGTRTIRAFLLAPLAIPVVFAFALLLGRLFLERDNSVKNGTLLIGWFTISSYGMVIAYLCELTIGIVVWKIFKYFSNRTPIAFAVAGGVMGWLFTVLIVKGVASVSNQYFWIDLVGGTCCAALFRLVVFSGDRDVAHPK
jgi:hypothetical protein